MQIHSKLDSWLAFNLNNWWYNLSLLCSPFFWKTLFISCFLSLCFLSLSFLFWYHNFLFLGKDMTLSQCTLVLQHQQPLGWLSVFRDESDCRGRLNHFVPFVRGEWGLWAYTIFNFLLFKVQSLNWSIEPILSLGHNKIPITHYDAPAHSYTYSFLIRCNCCIWKIAAYAPSTTVQNQRMCIMFFFPSQYQITFCSSDSNSSISSCESLNFHLVQFKHFQHQLFGLTVCNLLHGKHRLPLINAIAICNQYKLHFFPL